MLHRLHAHAPRRGTVAVFVAVSLTTLMGFVAVALDGGLLLQDRRTVQAAADASALAAAADLFMNIRAGKGLDTGGTATTKALGVATINGYNNDLTNSKVTVHIPPQSGTFVGQVGYAEVIIELYRRRAFSAIWLGGPTTVRARAVARGTWVPFRNGILVLDPTSSGALNNNGGGNIVVSGADVIVDSNAPDAALTTGGGSISAPNFYITGVPGTSSTGGGGFIGNIVDNQMPTPDPLAYLPEPDPTTMVLQSKNPTHAAGGQTLSLQPGVYQGGITVTGQASLVMAPGIYYMDGGGFSFSGSGSLTAIGVMIVNAPNKASTSNAININGLGSVVLSPPTTGIYQGISIWQTRNATNEVDIAGNGASNITGTFYAQHGTLKVTGNGGQNVLGSQYISWDVNLGGNGGFGVTWQAGTTAPARVLQLVE